MRPIIIANWKMNLTLEEAYNKAKYLDSANYSSKLLLSPPTPYLSFLKYKFKNLDFCAQDISLIKGFGPYTGEYSSSMIKSCDINYAIIGHSERRDLGENYTIISQKILNCLDQNITPIICIGENIENRTNNNYQKFILDQIDEIIQAIKARETANIIIAYEPYWSIGSGLVPKINEISEILRLIKSYSALYLVAKNVKLVYGGSVTSRNYKNILSIQHIDGLMLGSTSLQNEKLYEILNN